MILTLVHPNTGCKYQIKPSETGLDYKIYKQTNKGGKTKSGKTIKNDWSFTGKYPSDISSAILMTIDMMFKDPDDNTEFTFEIKDKKYVNQIYNKTLKGFVDSIQTTIRKKRNATKKTDIQKDTKKK